ncbi:MAG: DUF2344 domain-containing protein [Firmicutes bacterium]|nr:DUF2344 domain-containing protein [Bacillota bacterium]
MAIIRIKYEKLQPVRYISHLDLMRAFERALRRAQMPIAYTQGFHPRPKFSLASALAVGITSEAEYGDFELVQAVNPEEFAAKVNAYLPEGVRILAASLVAEDTPKLMAVVDRATYRCIASPTPGVDIEAVTEAADQLMASPQVVITRERKGKIREVDIRPFLFDISVAPAPDELTEQDLDKLAIDFEVASGSAGNLRPEELLRLLPIEPHQTIHRTGLFITVNGKPESPMEGIPRGVESEGS